MATKILREEQRCRSLNIYLMLLFFILLTVGALVKSYFVKTEGLITSHTFLIGVLLVLAGIAWFVLYRVKMEIKVSKKGLNVRHYPMHPKKLKIKWDEVDDYEFVNTSDAAQWKGWDVHFSTFGERYYSLCGRTGMRIHTKDGENIFIGSKKLPKMKDKIERFLRKDVKSD